ncbi:carbon-nitrogen hydrolase family protein [Cupriavidus basilensis]|uniref:carbon-nitrogen hydrolase family protein n=1 Tax=Cupriavidus basilensis TaxID=68895 RepID=UPI000750F04F|nr:carbon-nitrogen hydrolase family protein [Cupriavidus basilensis]
MSSATRFRAAACHVCPIYFDLDATVDKTCALIAEAAGHGARIVAFPEAHLCAFPVWSGVRAPVENHEFFVRMARSAVTIDHPAIDRIRRAARAHGIVVSLGINEASKASVGCIWDTNLLIGADGSLLNRHRKLVPTYWEKLTWANGDGSGLRVVDTPVGKVGALVCGENTNPLARYSLMAQGEQIHIASYSPCWPTHPAASKERYDLAAAICIRSGAHSFEAKCFTIVASGFFSDAAAELVCRGEPAARALVESAPRSVSMIIGPTGAVISDTLQDEEGIVYADIDLDDCIVPKQFHDVVGAYNRFDVFTLHVNRAALEPAAFHDALHDLAALPPAGADFAPGEAIPGGAA